MKIVRTLIVLVLIMLNGCATIISGGGKQKITIVSTPADAEIIIHDGNGYRVRIPDLRTPASFNLSRKRGFFMGADYQVELRKDGYLPQTVHLRSGFNTYYILNAVTLAGSVYLATLQDKVYDPDDYFGNPPDDKKYGAFRAVGYGGIAVSLFTDPITGAMFKFSQNQIDITLQRDPGADIQSITSAVNRATASIMRTLSKDMKIAVIDTTPTESELGSTATNQLEHTLFNNNFQVLDRNQLNRIRAEQMLQMSGDVDDSTAVEIGKFAGADVVVCVSVSESDRTLRIRALSVQTAQVVGSGLERY